MPRPVPPPSRRPRRLALVAAAALALATACTSSDAATPTADGTTTSTVGKQASTTSTTAEPEASPADTQAVRTAYIDAYTALATASIDPMRDHSSLDQYFEGPSLDYAVGALDVLSSGGVRVEYPSGGPPTPSVGSVDFASPTEAQVLACLIDTGSQIEVATGKTLDDQVVSRATKGTLHLTEGRWRLTDAESEGEWKDGSGCSR